jgi:hypothetical protein
MIRHLLITIAMAVAIYCPFRAVADNAAQKDCSSMSADEVAKDPASCGYTQGGTMGFEPVNGSKLPRSHDDQWTKKMPGNKISILTIHYDESGKMVSAHWGGF